MNNIILTESELKDLKKLKKYFIRNDKTLFEHTAYNIIDSIINKAEDKKQFKHDCEKSKRNCLSYRSERCNNNCIGYLK